MDSLRDEWFNPFNLQILLCLTSDDLPVNGGFFLDECINRVHTHFQTKHSRTFQGLSRVIFWNFKDLLFKSKNLPKEIVWQYNSCSFSTTYIRKNNAKALVTILNPTARRAHDLSTWSFLLKFAKIKNAGQKKYKDFQGLKNVLSKFKGFEGFSKRVRNLRKGAMQTGLCCTCDVKCTWLALQEPYEFSSSSPCHMWLQCNTCAETKRKKKNNSWGFYMCTNSFSFLLSAVQQYPNRD